MQLTKDPQRKASKKAPAKRRAMAEEDPIDEPEPQGPSHERILSPPTRKFKLNDIIEEERILAKGYGSSNRDRQPPRHRNTTLDQQRDSDRITVVADVHSEAREYENIDNLRASDSPRAYKDKSVNNARDPMDPMTRLAGTLEALVANKEASVSEHDSRLGNRLKFANKLPKFSGNPLEWLHFRESYKDSSQLGGFTDRENLARLFEALSGDARETVQMLLATTCDANAIIETLELHYGNKDQVARRIASDITGLPDLKHRNSDIVKFATKLRNAVRALKSLKRVGYLYREDLIKSVVNKLPSGLTYTYYRHVASLDSDETNLEKLANFLYKEAEYAIEAGIFDLGSESPSREDNGPPKKKAKTTETVKIYACAERPDKDKSCVNSSDCERERCLFCERNGHTLSTCTGYAKQTPERRWFYAKKHRLCFNCLAKGHRQTDCQSPRCQFCRRRHHNLLHRSARDTSRSNARTNSSTEGNADALPAAKTD